MSPIRIINITAIPFFNNNIK